MNNSSILNTIKPINGACKWKTATNLWPNLAKLSTANPGSPDKKHPCYKRIKFFLSRPPQKKLHKNHRSQIDEKVLFVGTKYGALHNPTCAKK